MKRGKCLALAAVLAMVVCAFAVAMPAGETDAAVQTSDIEDVDDMKELTSTASDEIEAGGIYYVDSAAGGKAASEATQTEPVTIYLVGKDASITLTGTATYVTIYLAVDSGTDEPTKYYAGLEIPAQATEYSVNDAASAIVMTAAATTEAVYGIMVKDTSYYYYPEGSTVQFSEVGDTDAITVIDGSATLTAKNSKGTAVNVVKLRNVVSDEGVTITASGTPNDTTASAITLEGTWEAGTVEVSKGTLTMNGSNGPTDDGVLTVQSAATLDITGGLTLAGKMNLYGTLTEDGTNPLTVTTDGEFYTYTGAEITTTATETDKIITRNGTGIVDLSGVQEAVTFEGTIKSGNDYVYDQVVNVSGTSTITGVTITIYGTLNIPAGAELKIANGAELIIDGTVADVNIEGTLTINSDSTFTVNDADVQSVSVTGQVVSEGALTVESENFVIEDEGSLTAKGTVDIGAMTVDAGGKATLSGTVTIDSMDNAGAVVLSEAVIGANSTISLTAMGAYVSVEKVTVTSSVSLTIDDKTLTGEDQTEAVNSVVVAGEDSSDGNIVSGLTVTAATITEDETITGYLDLSGEVSQKVAETSGTDGVTLTVDGTGLTVADELTLGEDVTLAFASGDEVLAVAGTLTALEDAKQIDTTQTATITITGAMLVHEDFDQGETLVINAVMYETEKTELLPAMKVYTTLSAAIDIGAEEITVVGDVVVEESDTVPFGTTLTIPNTATLTVGSEDIDGVVLTIDYGAAVVNSGEIVVIGTLYFEDTTDSTLGTIISDVKVVSEDSAKYTNIYTALDEAVSGETVTVTKADEVELTKNLTVKDGVTLVVPDDSTLVLGAKITINVIGEMYVDNAITDDDYEFNEELSVLKVQGKFFTVEDITGCYAKYLYNGAYYQYDGSSNTYTVMTTLATAVADENVDDGKIYVYGTVSAGAIVVDGTESEQMTVQVVDAAKLTAESISLTWAVFDVDGTFTGKIVTDEGSVAMDSVKGFEVEENGEMVFNDGITSGKSMTVSSGTVTVGSMDISALTAFAIASGATVEVDGEMTAEDLTIAGSVGVLEGSTLNVTGVLTISGSLAVDEDATLKAVEVYVGMTSAEVNIGAAAVLSASDVPTGLKQMYVAAGATVSADAVAGVACTTIIVEGVEKFTVYDNEGTLEINDISVPGISGAEFDYWTDANGNEIADGTLVGATGTSKVTAQLNFNVYSVKIVADYGFTDVYIDGAKYATIAGGEIVYVDEGYKLQYGEHSVTWKVRNNYDDSKVTTTFDGKEFTGSFTIDRSMDFDDAYYLVLSGVEPQGPVTPVEEKKDSTLTDVLLIVLVVLIAIMAIMVALRLMRS